MEDGFFNLKSLREQVYEYLKIQLNEGKLEHGAFLNLNAISAEMGISKTPLRDALFQLEAEGFVTIYPRRGVKVNVLSLEKIRNIYQILGGLEGARRGLRTSGKGVIRTPREELREKLRVGTDRLLAPERFKGRKGKSQGPTPAPWGR